MASTATAGKKKYGLPVKVAVVLLIFVQMTQAFCNPSLAGIMADFPEAPVTTVQTIINIATLVMIPAALVTGPIVNKIGYKTTGIIAMVIALVGGVAPAFVHPSVEFMIFERGVFGIGYGMVYTLSIAACGEFWRGKATTGVVGAVNFGAGLAGILYNLLAGALAPMGWEVIYYGYFIIVPIMVYYAIVMPQHSDLPKGEAAEGEKKAKVTLASFGTQFWLYIIGMALAIASAAAFMNNIAMIVVGTGIDATGAAVATIMTGFTVGMMIGGAAYPLLYGLLKRAAMAVYLLLDARGVRGHHAVRRLHGPHGHGGGDRHRVQRPQLRLGRHGEQEGARLPVGVRHGHVHLHCRLRALRSSSRRFSCPRLPAWRDRRRRTRSTSTTPQSPFWPWAASSCW